MRGVNRIVLSGAVMGPVRYAATRNGIPSCTFTVLTERHGNGEVVTVRTKVNLYGEGLVRLCKNRISIKSYVIVEGELMNREGAESWLVEVRAKDIVIPRVPETETEGEPRDEG